MPAIALAPAARVAHLDPAILNNAMNVRAPIATCAVLAKGDKVFYGFRCKIGEKLHHKHARQDFAVSGQCYVAVIALKPGSQIN